MRVFELLKEDDWHNGQDSWHGGGNEPKDAWYSPDGGGAATGEINLGEAPLELDPAEPNNPTVFGHQQANPMKLSGRIQQTRAQLKDLAQMADSNDLLVWERICKLAKGGMFMGLEQNLEQIRHGIEELAKVRKQGGTRSRGIDKNIG